MNRLKELREEKKLLQNDVAQVIGVTAQAVGLYERGLRDMSIATIIKLSDYFECSSDYLLGRPVSKNNEKRCKIGNNSGIEEFNFEGLTDEDIEELQKLADHIRKIRQNCNDAE